MLPRATENAAAGLQLDHTGSEHSRHVMPPSACRVNIFISRDSSKPFSLIHDWKVLLLDAADWLLAETDDAFEILKVECCPSCTTESKEPLQITITAAGVWTLWLANSKKFLFRLTTKILLYVLHFFKPCSWPEPWSLFCNIM